MVVFYSQVYNQEDTGGRYYQYANLSDEADFAAYVEQVKKAALYDTEVNAQYKVLWVMEEGSICENVTIQRNAEKPQIPLAFSFSRCYYWYEY